MASVTLTWRQKLILFAVSFLIGLVCCELVAQLAGFIQWRRSQVLRTHSEHYYQPSANPDLVYELKPGFYQNDEGLDLTIGPDGFRIDPQTKVPASAESYALLGDSNIFGIEAPTKFTLQVLIENALGNKKRIYNFSVPGYGFREEKYLYESVSKKFKFSRLFYFLNLNDFALRDSPYEGADNGLYRMYRRPWFQLPWYINKARYRYYKRNEQVATPEWYQWIYQGTKQESFGYLKDMLELVRKQNIDLCVVIVPAVGSFTPEGYALKNIHEDIEKFLSSLGVSYIDTTEHYTSDLYRYFDETEHMTVTGNRKTVEALLNGKGSCKIY